MAQEIADSTLLDTWGSGGNIVEPDISKIIEGWQLGEQPPHEYMNWLQNTFGSKLNHILKNGVASWNNETEYLAGATTQHSGNVWLCKTTNTNSEPADVNANWKRIITIEALTTVLGGYVATTGDQDIDDIKTFLKSPIVPTPTIGTQAVNKDYADLKVALASFIGTNQSLSGSGYQKLPGGLIVQWGVAPDSNNTTLTRNFPIAFPNSVFLMVGSQRGATVQPQATAFSASSAAQYQYRSSGGSSPVGASYIAIGY